LNELHGGPLSIPFPPAQVAPFSGQELVYQGDSGLPHAFGQPPHHHHQVPHDDWSVGWAFLEKSSKFSRRKGVPTRDCDYLKEKYGTNMAAALNIVTVKSLYFRSIVYTQT
jgi:hypothetical protein